MVTVKLETPHSGLTWECNFVLPKTIYKVFWSASRSRGVAWPIISACRAEDPGSNPGAGAILLDLTDIIIRISTGLGFIVCAGKDIKH